LLEYRAKLESAIVQNGHRLAISLASRNFSTASALSEIWQGIHQIKTIKALTGDLSDERLRPLPKIL
jgi:presequence protease